MKFSHALVGVFFVLLTASVAMAQSLDVQSLITKGQSAYQHGDLGEAKLAFELAYKLDPRNQTVIQYLRRIKVDLAARPKSIDQKNQLATVIIPQIQFEEAPLDLALEYFKMAVDRETGGKQSINFVVQLPP